MSDLDKLRMPQLDQLQPQGIYDFRYAVTSAQGTVFRPGAYFHFDFAIVNVKTGDAEVHGWSQEGEEATIRTHGGEHQRLFIETGREWRQRRPESVPSEPPPEGPAAWLARQPGFESASAIMRGNSGSDWYAARRDADLLHSAAMKLRTIQPFVARWVADEALDRYHAWMSQATSGGEGCALHNEVADELKELRKLIGKD